MFYLLKTTRSDYYYSYYYYNNYFKSAEKKYSVFFWFYYFILLFGLFNNPPISLNKKNLYIPLYLIILTDFTPHIIKAPSPPKKEFPPPLLQKNYTYYILIYEERIHP